MELVNDVLALVLLGAGTLFGLAARERKFDRTNAFGTERYPSFEAKLRRKSGDFGLLGGAIGSLAVGTILLASNHVDSWGWIIIAPVCLLVLYLLLGT